MPPKRGGGQQQGGGGGRGSQGRGDGGRGGRGYGGGGGRSQGGGGNMRGRGQAGRGAATTPQAPTPQAPRPVPMPPPAPTLQPPAAPLTAQERRAQEVEEEEEEKLSAVLEEKASIVAPMVALHFPPRPGYGRLGTPVALLANHFKVTFRANQDDIYHYDVSMAEASGRKFGNGNGVPPKSLAEKIVRALLATMKRMYPHEMVVSDMRKNLYTPRRLPFHEQLFSDLDIGEKRGADQTPVLFQAVVKEADPVAIRMSQLTALFDGQLNYTPYDALQALDIVLRHTAAQRMTLVGRNLYSPRGAKDLGEGAECWNGYFQSVRPTQNRLVINLDLSATAFVKAMDVMDFVYEAIRSRDRAMPPTLTPSQASTASKALRGVKVEITHRPGVKRLYRVNGLSPRSAADTFFDADESGNRMSVQQYFAQTYKIQLRYPKLPCIHVGAANKKTYFPMEVCRIVAGQKCPRKITDRQTSEMIKVAKTNPVERKTRIDQIVREANFAQDPTLQAFGVGVDPKMVKTQGRMLAAPTLTYGGGQTVRPAGGSWRADRLKFYQLKPLESFAVIVLDDRMHDGALKNFFAKVLSQAAGLGMTSAQQQLPPMIKMRRGRAMSEVYGEALKAAHAMYKKPAQLVWTVNPFADAHTYGEIKRASDTEYGIPSQCMLARHVETANPQYIGNILLKVHVKIGGRNWKMADPVAQKVTKRTIIFGADVTHPSPGDTTKPSIAALVGSINHDFTAHASCIRAQGHRVEQIVNLKEMVVELMKAFYRSERAKPANILFYRDGVSEGQFQMVLNSEVTAIREACATLEKGYEPAITFIIVQKRHHTRFFVSNAKDADRSGNVKAGVVVDTGVCHPSEYDFYLMSHAGLQGTSRPTHYHVLLDEIRLSADELQALTYRLCYTYARCLKSVSMVPSAYYSHLLAYRARFFTPDGLDSSSGIGSSSEASGSSETTDMRLYKTHLSLLTTQYYI